MKAWVHLPIKSNQPVSQSWLTVGGASSLCQWSVLLPHDYRCDLSHLSPSMRQLSTFFIQTIIAWFSNGLKCKCSELCCRKKKKFPSWSLRGEQDGRAAGAALSLNPGAWLNQGNAHFASRHRIGPNIQAEIRNTVSLWHTHKSINYELWWNPVKFSYHHQLALWGQCWENAMRSISSESWSVTSHDWCCWHLGILCEAQGLVRDAIQKRSLLLRAAYTTWAHL